MEMASKRRPDGATEPEADEETKRPRRGADDGGKRSVTEEEVEEFYAILRRLRDVRRCIGREKVGNVVRTATTTWQPTFVWEDFKELGDVRDDGAKETAEEEVVENIVEKGFDLNAKPPAEDVNPK